MSVRQKDQPVIACEKPRSGLDGAELEGIESFPVHSHNLKPYIRVVVVMAELSNSFSEGPSEERHVEHVTAIGRLALEVKSPAETRLAPAPEDTSGAAIVRAVLERVVVTTGRADLVRASIKAFGQPPGLRCRCDRRIERWEEPVKRGLVAGLGILTVAILGFATGIVYDDDGGDEATIARVTGAHEVIGTQQYDAEPRKQGVAKCPEGETVVAGGYILAGAFQTQDTAEGHLFESRIALSQVKRVPSTRR